MKLQIEIAPFFPLAAALAFFACTTACDFGPAYPESRPAGGGDGTMAAGEPGEGVATGDLRQGDRPTPADDDDDPPPFTGGDDDDDLTPGEEPGDDAAGDDDLDGPEDLPPGSFNSGGEQPPPSGAEERCKLYALPENLDFGKIQIGMNQAARLTFLLVNNGWYPCTISGIKQAAGGQYLISAYRHVASGASYGSPEGWFTELPAPYVIDIGRAVEVRVDFIPQQEGEAEDVIGFYELSESRWQEVRLFGYGVRQSGCRLQIDPAPISSIGFSAIYLGEVAVGGAQSATVNFTNVGSGDCRLQSISAGPGLFPDFKVGEYTSFPAELEPGGRASIEMTYSPSAPGLAGRALSASWCAGIAEDLLWVNGCLDTWFVVNTNDPQQPNLAAVPDPPEKWPDAPGFTFFIQAYGAQ